MAVFGHVGMRVPLLFALNNLFNGISTSWKLCVDLLTEVGVEHNIPSKDGQQFPFLHVLICILGVICLVQLFVLPSRILSKFYILILSCGILRASHWWTQQFLTKLHSNSSFTQWDYMFIERTPESWRHFEIQHILFSRDLLIFAILQCSYASLFAILLGQHIEMFLPRAVLFCNFIMFLPILVAISIHEPRAEINLNLLSVCQWVTVAVSAFIIFLWMWSLIFISSTLRFKEFFQMIQTIRRDLGIQMLFEHEWKRLHVPTLLRVFWMSNTLWLAAGHYVNLGNFSQFNVTMLKEIGSEVAIAGCGSMLMLLGMSAVIAKIANHVGCLIHMIIKSTDDEEKYIGTVSAVLFFILALQTGLTELEGEARLVRLFRNSCLLFTAILHFIHNMLNQVMLSLGASQSMSFKRHFRVLSVALLLLVVPFCLFYYLWTSYEMSTWILAVSAFCLELCIKVLVTTSVYTLFMIDACCNTYWENLDDYVYYIKGTGSVIEFLFGIFLFFNGGWILLFESGGIIRAFMMSIHAYFNIFVQAKEGWKMFQNRRTAVSKINNLPFATESELSGHDDVCSICYHELLVARVTPCGHLFHGMCLRKWLYLQDVCPMCQKKLVEKNTSVKSEHETPLAEVPENNIPPAENRDNEQNAQDNHSEENEQSTSNSIQDTPERTNNLVHDLGNHLEQNFNSNTSLRHRRNNTDLSHGFFTEIVLESTNIEKAYEVTSESESLSTLSEDSDI